jgi:hypothetical protein
MCYAPFQGRLTGGRLGKEGGRERGREVVCEMKGARERGAPLSV